MKQPPDVLKSLSVGSSDGADGIAMGTCALPVGIVRVSDQAIAAERYLPAGSAADGRSDGRDGQGPVRLAAFDFDGTSVTGNSPVMLVRYLRKYLRKSVLVRIVSWALAYKMRLPQNEAWVRGLVFSAFRDKPVTSVNEFLWRFYAEKVAPRFRPSADERMQQHIDRGDVVVCVSATFEPIIAAAMTEHPIMFGIATRMAMNEDGTYTDRVEGMPVEGPEKLAALTRFADERFGENGWVLACAYGDHHSDRTLLAAAEQAFAVTPDHPLARTAKREGYPILSW